ncbi:MAG TPA: M4 family metallopeptidase [Labilithrix sp.]|nr:M4 family metallopeptidase [Labilithrix sp.]
MRRFGEGMKKSAVFALAIVAAGGCSSGDPTEEAPTARVSSALATPSQLDAFQMLAANTQRSWTWVQDQDLKTPKHLGTSRMPSTRIGAPVLGMDRDAVKATLSVLTENKALFRMREPELELSVSRTHVDELGMTHARFQQMVHGVPVSGAELAAHYDPAGHITSIDANYVADLDDVDVNPKLLESDARALAHADVAARTAVDEATLETPPGTLVVYAPKQAAATLAYEFTVRAMAAERPAIWVVTVDAKTGSILHGYDNLQTVQGKGAGVLGDDKEFEITVAGEGFALTDSTTSVQIKTLTAARQKIRGSAVTSSDPNSWDTGVPGAGSAVDAHVNAGAVYRYYRDKHKRNAINGKGGALVSTVHYGVAYDNAAWDGSGMIYGDGGDMFLPPSVSLDVVGHEFTHGVTERTSALIYENQPGALNEAVSDIFGAFIEHSVTPDEAKNWTMGEAVTKAGGALRDMRDPGAVAIPQPAHMSQYWNTQQDNGGVHANSGIINNAAYLMTVGGVNPVSNVEVPSGIGWAKSERLWYRANTEYFLKTTDFGQAAHGLLEAAKDIGLTEEETQIVARAFVATGIIDESGSETPAVEESSEDSTPRRRLVITRSSSCSAAPGGGSVGHVALAFAACAGLAWKRRRKG